MLSDDEIINICKFLTVQNLGIFSCCSRTVYLCSGHEDLWAHLLLDKFPYYASFSETEKSRPIENGFENTDILRNNSLLNEVCSFPYESCRFKLKNFISNSFSMTSLGELQLFRSRLLHRCVTDQNGVSYIFGGAAITTNTNFGSFRDVWKVAVNEIKQQIKFSRVQMDAPSKKFSFFPCLFFLYSLFILADFLDFLSDNLINDILWIVLRLRHGSVSTVFLRFSFTSFAFSKVSG
jgi:hypothetical protein